MVRCDVLSYLILLTGQNVAWFRGIVLAVGLLAVAGSSQAQGRLTLAGRHVVVWRPVETSSRQPVVFFSHGFSGCATQSTFLMKALAAHGYWVFAMDHKDARCGDPGRGLARPAVPFIRPDSWSDKSFEDRRNDVRAVRAALETSAEYKGHLDWNRVGLVGHSLGGYTVLGLAGAWQSWEMPGIKAVLALSPYAQPFIAHNTLAGLRAPVMYQGGTRDVGITPWIKKNAGAYDESPAPRYFVEFDGFGHFAWTDLQLATHKPIVDYSLAFLDHYVRGLPAPELLTHATSQVATLRYDSELGKKQNALR